MTNDPNKKDDDDDLGFELADGIEISDPVPKVELESVTNLRQLETGAFSTYVDADIDRKGFVDTHSGLEVLIPNEDSCAANTINIGEKEEPGQLLHRVMKYVDGLYTAREDGSTLTSALVVDGKLYTANMGDSPALVITIDPAADPESEHAVTVRQITRNHVADDEEERKLLPNPELVFQNEHGRSYVFTEDKSSGVMTTRAVGDRGKKLNHTPEIQTLDLSADVKTGKEVFVVVGSDGIMEHTDVENIQRLLQRMNAHTQLEVQRGLKADEIAILLASYRYNPFSLDGVEYYKRNDDTTLVVQPVTQDMLESKTAGGKKEAQLITLADGHFFRFELAPDGNLTYDSDHKAITKYETPLSQAAVASMQKFMRYPNLMQESKIQRQA